MRMGITAQVVLFFLKIIFIIICRTMCSVYFYSYGHQTFTRSDPKAHNTIIIIITIDTSEPFIV